MFVFGHIGIGRRLIGRWRHRLPTLPLVAGMLLPDLIDKPLYYARVWPLINCTRTFGHTGLFLLGLIGAAVWARSRALAAVAAGAATHLSLDLLMDAFGEGPGASWMALTWPFLHQRFADVSMDSLSAHLGRLLVGPVVIAELIGLGLLAWEWSKSRAARPRH